MESGSEHRVCLVVVNLTTDKIYFNITLLTTHLNTGSSYFLRKRVIHYTGAMHWRSYAVLQLPDVKESFFLEYSSLQTNIEEMADITENQPQ